MHIEVLDLEHTVGSEECKTGEVYQSVERAGTEGGFYLCAYSMSSGHIRRFMVELASGSIYPADAFPTTRFIAISSRVVLGTRRNDD